MPNLVLSQIAFIWEGGLLEFTDIRTYIMPNLVLSQIAFIGEGGLLKFTDIHTYIRLYMRCGD